MTENASSARTIDRRWSYHNRDSGLNVNFYVTFGIEFTGGVATARLRSDKVYGSTHRCRVTKAVVCLIVHFPVDPVVLPCYILPLF